ncbi:hypothetical protein EMIHUDRAFT_453932 [Emiliania huxleyi CCMP1516]|uniref:Glutaredoxin domain-containing protein n=2 Tax=Emiliania huxleyi TaxID=2903 RepID=A0A0D3HZ08_EMIH1|nr:hypothetical protein EMIHUDRAFT_453932 [Emiliania huxleyi CCMP1516]EOD04243.1 hypothetical protein EMIHUDRAFT_453932 [Emiliania huxleyi CCMP1516]|eukprot:XP_005756672.1 hypothetical protein EMIHUDRAFT_453932 [Emiliania huxleyi CCMP1516]
MGVLEHDDYAGKLLYLHSSQSSSQLVIVAQRKLETQLESYSVPFVKIDGMELEKKEVRKAIWEMSDQKPGTYPILVDMVNGKCYAGDDLQASQDTGSLQTALTTSYGSSA